MLLICSAKPKAYALKVQHANSLICYKKKVHLCLQDQFPQKIMSQINSLSFNGANK